MYPKKLKSTPRISGMLSENEIIQRVNNAIHAKDVVCYLFTDQSITQNISNSDMKFLYSQPMPLLIHFFDISVENISDFVSWKGYSNQMPIGKKSRFVSKISAYIREDYYMNIILYMAKYNVSFTMLFMSITRNYKTTRISRSADSPIRNIHKLYPHFMFQASLKDSKILATAGEFLTVQLTFNIEDIFFEGDDELNIAIGQL